MTDVFLQPSTACPATKCTQSLIHRVAVTNVPLNFPILHPSYHHVASTIPGPHSSSRSHTYRVSANNICTQRAACRSGDRPAASSIPSCVPATACRVSVSNILHCSSQATSSGGPATVDTSPAESDYLVASTQPCSPATVCAWSSTCRITVVNVFLQPSYGVLATLPTRCTQHEIPVAFSSRNLAFSLATLPSRVIHSLHVRPSLQHTYSSPLSAPNIMKFTDVF